MSRELKLNGEDRAAAWAERYRELAAELELRTAELEDAQARLIDIAEIAAPDRMQADRRVDAIAAALVLMLEGLRMNPAIADSMSLKLSEAIEALRAGLPELQESAE
jgi:hypothetical protein